MSTADNPNKKIILYCVYSAERSRNTQKSWKKSLQNYYGQKY